MKQTDLFKNFAYHPLVCQLIDHLLYSLCINIQFETLSFCEQVYQKKARRIHPIILESFEIVYF